MHYYQHHIGDFIKDTAFLTNEEVGIYMKLLWLYYDSESPLQNNLKVLALKVNARDKEFVVHDILANFFQLVDDEWHHTRCDKEIAEYAEFCAKQKANGLKGGRPKSTQEKPTENPSVTQGIPKKTLTTNHKPLTTNHLYTDSFNEFWKVYPRHESKKEAAQAFSKVTEPLEVLIKSVKAQTIARNWDKKENFGFIPHASTWLNQRRWEDEVVQVSSKPKELPLATDKQIEEAYRIECGGDPTKARFNSYQEMRKFVLDNREKANRASE